MDRQTIQGLGKVAILPISAHLGLLILWDLGSHLIASLLLVTVGFLGILLAERRLRDQPRGQIVLSVIGVAVVLRLLLLPLPPSLSEDVERYVWDGRVLAEGFNPYLLPPDAAELKPLRDPHWEGLPHRDVPTVYPPLAELLFALAAILPSPVFLLKAALALADLGTCYLLLLLARAWSLPAERTLWYAWNPLVTIEIAAMGHVDGLGVALMVLSTVLLIRTPERMGRASVAALGAVLTKLVPLLAIPVWARASSRPWLFATMTLVLCGLALLPVVLASGGAPPGLIEYGVSWEFNGPLFEPLWRLLDRLDLRSAVEAGLDRLKDSTGRHELWNRLYPFNYPQLWAKGLLAMGLSFALLWAWRTRDTGRALGRVFGSTLVFSATVYPWYALWVLPWAALHRRAAWLALSGLLFLSYLPKFCNVSLYPWIQAMIWLPFVAVLVLERWWSTR